MQRAALVLVLALAVVGLVLIGGGGPGCWVGLVVGGLVVRSAWRGGSPAGR